MDSPHEQVKTKTWWAAVWRGLVVDDQAKHYHRLRGALWLYVYLIIHADRQTGQLTRRYRTIVGEMHLPERTIRRYLATLRREGYFITRNSGRALVIHIQQWKP